MIKAIAINSRHLEIILIKCVKKFEAKKKNKQRKVFNYVEISFNILIFFKLVILEESLLFLARRSAEKERYVHRTNIDGL